MERKLYDLKPCPDCGFAGKLRKRKNKYYAACTMCFTETERFSFPEDAVKKWNSLEPKVAEPEDTRTNIDLIQSAGIANLATFLQSWEENHGRNWADMTEDEIINWLASPADSELEDIVNF